MEFIDGMLLCQAWSRISIQVRRDRHLPISFANLRLLSCVNRYWSAAKSTKSVPGTAARSLPITFTYPCPSKSAFLPTAIRPHRPAEPSILAWYSHQFRKGRWRQRDFLHAEDRPPVRKDAHTLVRYQTIENSPVVSTSSAGSARLPKVDV